MKDPQHPANDRKTQGYQKVQGAHNECIDDYNLYQAKHSSQGTFQPASLSGADSKPVKKVFNQQRNKRILQKC